jgi:hypothetical protein
MYNIQGIYDCNNIESMTNITKMPLPTIGNDFKNFNLCKSFNKNKSYTIVNNELKVSPKSVKAFKCDKNISASHINDVLKKNKCYSVLPNTTVVPYGETVQNIINGKTYSNNLFDSEESICQLDNDKYIVCDNNNISYKITSNLKKKEYCFKGTENNDFNQSQNKLKLIQSQNKLKIR